jgi:hypothetical protein
LHCESPCWSDHPAAPPVWPGSHAIARIAGLLAIAAVGAVISVQFSSSLDHHLAGIKLSPAQRTVVAQSRRQTFTHVDPSRAGSRVSIAIQSASVHAFHVGIAISASLVALGGILGLAGIRNPRRVVRCEDCAGGQLAGQPLDAAHNQPPTPRPVPTDTQTTMTPVT